MKPLVYYCRWQKASLRLRGRDSTSVWGQLVYTAADEEKSRKFRYYLEAAELIVFDEAEEIHYLLDEKGIPLAP